MIRLIQFFILAVACAQAHPVSALGERTIELHTSSEIADIELLDQQVEQLVAKVRQCAAVGLAPASDCYCYYPGKLESTRQAYEDVVSKHPSWADGSVRWWTDDGSFSSSLYLRGIRQQIEQPCT